MVLVLAMMCGFAQANTNTVYGLTKDPVDRVTEALAKTEDGKTDISFEFSVDLDEAKLTELIQDEGLANLVKKLAEKVKLTGFADYVDTEDNDTFKTNIKYALEYDKKQIISIESLFNNFEYTFYMPEFSKDTVFINSLSAYVNTFDIAQDTDTYIEEPANMESEIVEVPVTEAVAVEAPVAEVKVSAEGEDLNINTEIPLEEDYYVVNRQQWDYQDMIKMWEVINTDDSLLTQLKKDHYYKRLIKDFWSFKIKEDGKVDLVSNDGVKSTTTKTDVYSIKLTANDLYDLSTKALQYAKIDANTKNFIFDRCEKMKVLIAEDDVLSIEEQQYYIESIDEVKANYEEIIDEMIASIQLMREDVIFNETLPTINLKLYIDRDNNILGLDMSAEIQGFAFNYDIRICEYKGENLLTFGMEQMKKVDIAKLDTMDPVEAQKMMTELMINGYKNVMKNEGTVDLIKDTKFFAKRFLTEEQAAQFISLIDEAIMTAEQTITMLEASMTAQ